MGLQIINGPKWKEDSLNKIDEESLKVNTIRMYKERTFLYRNNNVTIDIYMGELKYGGEQIRRGE